MQKSGNLPCDFSSGRLPTWGHVGTVNPLQPLRPLPPTVLDLGIGLPHDRGLSPPCHGSEGSLADALLARRGLSHDRPQKRQEEVHFAKTKDSRDELALFNERNCRSGRKSMKGNDSPKGLGSYKEALRRGARRGRPPKRSASRSFRFSSPSRGSGQLCGEGS